MAYYYNISKDKIGYNKNILCVMCIDADCN